MARRIKELHQAVPESYAEFHPEDAKAIGVSDGDQVKVESHRGFMREDCRVCHLGPGARPELVPKHGPRPKCELCHKTQDVD